MASDDHRRQAIAFFNKCWELLEQPPGDERDRELLDAAWSSLREWSVVGGPQEWTIGEWMLARCAGETGFGALAVDTALRAHDRARRFDAALWLLASTTEGVARAYVDVGDGGQAREWLERAERDVQAISDGDDRALIAAQLDDTRHRMAQNEGPTA